MRSAAVGCITFFLLALLPLAAAQTAEPQPASLQVTRATIASVKGDVAIHAVSGATLPPVRGQALMPGSVIETNKGSILLDLADGTQAEVKPNTRVVLKDPAKDQGFSLELFLGKLLAKIKKRMAAEPSFRLGTPTAVITVRGTEFLTEVKKNGTTEVHVYEGVVEVAGSAPGSRPVFVRPGFWTEVPPHRPPRDPVPTDLNRAMSSHPQDEPLSTGMGNIHSPSDNTQQGNGSGSRDRSGSTERERPDD